MKKFLALLIIACMLMTALASCNWFGGDKTPETKCTEHVDADKNYICDNCSAELKQPEVPPSPKPCDEHKDENGDLKCDACGADVPAPQPPACTEHKDEDGDYDCDACGHVMFENVEYSLNISDYAPVNPLASPLISSRFTVSQGTELRARTKIFEGIEYTNSVRIATKTDYIRISVPGTGKLTFIVENGSSSITTDQFTKVTDPDGKTYDYAFSNTGAVKIEIDVTEGDWIITRGKNDGTQYYYYFHLACTVATSEESGFELVSDGKTEYIVGETLDTTGVHLNATYANGKTETLPLANVSIDTSAVDMTTSGTYPVKITYKNYSPITYYVDVYAPTSIELGFDAIEKLATNSAAGNGVYYNHSFQEVYKIDETFNKKGLSVIVVATCGEKSLKFIVSDYEVSGFDSTTAGTKALTISASGVEVTAVVYVVDTAIAEGNQVKVEKGYNGTIGAVVDGYNMFATVQQALDYLARVPAAEQKLLVIGEGLFTEKLEITIPNLTIRGAGADKTTIEWDAIYGQVDAGGFAHITDSTATVAIRDAAVNCVIENITISNYWNSKERMQEGKLAIERALALLVQSDRFIMKNSRLLGIQDTLELFTGRQYFENVFISGYTDFVFGTNNTTYFKNCTIHTIDVDKDDNGTAGYLTAFKGSNKGEKDAIVYGAIFDGCKFTADEGVTTKQAIGRPWGAYAAVAVINSEIGGHISTVGYGALGSDGKAVDPRYTSMSGVLPTAETVQFVEYNNTGDGAIAEDVAGMRMLTAEEAAKYLDLAVIFGTVNGKVQYDDSWDPNSTEVKVDDRDCYYFNGETSITGTSHTFDTTTTIATGTTHEWDGLLISAENGNVAWNSNANALNMKTGAFIKFTVPAGTTVTVESYPGYNHFTLNGVGSSANKLSQHYAEETEVTLLSIGDLYLYSIIINPGEEAPEAPTLSEIKVEGMNAKYSVGDTLSYEGIVVRGFYSDNSVIVLEDYEINDSGVNTSANGSYNVVFSFGGVSTEVQVIIGEVVLPIAYHFDSKSTEGAINYQYAEQIQSATGTLGDMAIDATSGKVVARGSDTQINAGSKLTFTVTAGSRVTINTYPGYHGYSINGDAADEDTQVWAFEEDTTVVWTADSQVYLYSIIIEP